MPRSSKKKTQSVAVRSIARLDVDMGPGDDHQDACQHTLMVHQPVASP